jgi:hypothetical protein
MKLLATGIFMWFGPERQTDRYGAFYAADSSYDGIKPGVPVVTHDDAIKSLLLQRVRVVAKVIENRRSGHAGDDFHKLKPKPAKVGQEVEVGIGFLHANHKEGITFIELHPEDGRKTFWCNPRRFFELHDQTVEIYAEPTAAPAPPVFQGKPVDGDHAINNGDGTLQLKTQNPGGNFFAPPAIENLGDGAFMVQAQPIGRKGARIHLERR